MLVNWKLGAVNSGKTPVPVTYNKWVILTELVISHCFSVQVALFLPN